MPSYTLSVLGLEVSFKAAADRQRVQEAKELLEQRYEELNQHGRRLSKEKLLTFLALGLADDLLQSEERLTEATTRINEFLNRLDEVGATTKE